LGAGVSPCRAAQSQTGGRLRRSPAALRPVVTAAGALLAATRATTDGAIAGTTRGVALAFAICTARACSGFMRKRQGDAAKQPHRHRGHEGPPASSRRCSGSCKRIELPAIHVGLLPNGIGALPEPDARSPVAARQDRRRLPIGFRPSTPRGPLGRPRSHSDKASLRCAHSLCHERRHDARRLYGNRYVVYGEVGVL
jgi:hypothetical protein